MIDRSFQYFSQMLRAPDLRLGDIRIRLLEGTPAFAQTIDEPGRDLFVFARRGDFVFSAAGAPAVAVPEGATAGIDGGVAALRWRAVRAAADGRVELFVSSIPRRMSMLQQQRGGSIVVPPDAEPYAAILSHAVEMQLCEHHHAAAGADEAVMRRCAEISMIQLVRYARQRTIQQADAPPALAADESLLRAWTAYFAEPDRKWTLQALASAAGLSRTTFATRFRHVFGAPPLQTLTALRLEQAEAMLRNSTAPLIEIAFTVGYNSEAAFVRAFHRHYGMPPGRFRAERAAERILGETR